MISSGQMDDEKGETDEEDEAGDKSHDEQTKRMDRPAFHFSSFHRWSHMFSYYAHITP